MEKKEAIREWCVEKALTVLVTRCEEGFNTDDIVKIAEKLEKYITK